MFNHSNLNFCMFMAPKRDKEEHELLVDDRVKWTKPSQAKKITRRLSRYIMSVNPGFKHSRSQSTLSAFEEEDFDAQIDIPYIFIKKNKPIASIILFHANAEDIFDVENIGADLSTSLRVKFRFK